MLLIICVGFGAFDNVVDNPSKQIVEKFIEANPFTDTFPAKIRFVFNILPVSVDDVNLFHNETIGNKDVESQYLFIHLGKCLYSCIHSSFLSWIILFNNLS